MEPVLWSPLISLDSIPGMQMTGLYPFPGAIVLHIKGDLLHAIFLSRVLQILGLSVLDDS